MTAISILVFALFLWASSGPVDDGACDMYCGPANVLVDAFLMLLAPVTWLAAVLTVLAAFFAKRRLLALVCGLALLVPVLILTAMYVSTHSSSA